MTGKLVAALLLATLATAAQAAQTCTIQSSSGPVFGAYDPTSSQSVDAAGSINYSCTNGPRPVVQLSRGSSSSFAARTLKSGGNSLNYNLYTDAARSRIWGDGTGGSNTLTVNVGAGLSVPIYGRITGSQNVPAGSYTDTITVTIVF